MPSKRPSPAIRNVSLGKWRRLQQLAGPGGAFTVMALDHRGPMRRALEKERPGGGRDANLAALKQDIARSLAPLASAVLLDPETGAGRCVASGAVPGGTGLLVALDTGSTGNPADQSTGLVAGWSVEKASRLGAAGVKLLIYYHPDSPEAAAREALVAEVGRDCKRWEMPFFLEPILHHETAPEGLAVKDRLETAIETARRLAPLGADVLKVEFPAALNEPPDEKNWRRACEAFSAACPAPWVLLSGGVSFDLFLRQVESACESGASGVAAGRSVWSEAVTLDLEARRSFLKGEARDRLRRLRTLCDERARPFYERLLPPDLPAEWHARF